jgi:hypothetical protein
LVVICFSIVQFSSKADLERTEMGRNSLKHCGSEVKSGKFKLTQGVPALR